MNNLNLRIGKNIFISYAREDHEIAMRLYYDFAAVGLNPWIDKENLLPGQDWRQAITKAIGESTYFIALLSKNSISKQGYIQKELRIAFDIWSQLPPTTIFIIPARIEECEPLNEELSHLHWTDLFPSYEKGLERILKVFIPQDTEERSQRRQEKNSKDDIKKSGSKTVQADWQDAPTIKQFYGRQEELALLEKQIVEEKCRVIGIVGIGGSGKSSLAAKLSKNIESKFDFLFWRSLRNAPPIEEIIQDMLHFFSPDTSYELPSDFSEQLKLLLGHLKSNKCLIIFDNIESLLRSGDTAGAYRDGYELYRDLFISIIESPNNSCLVFTSREMPLEFSAFEGTKSPVYILSLDGLSVAASQEIFSEFSVKGSPSEVQSVVNFYGGNPLSLQLVANLIQEMFAGDIGLFLKESRPDVIIGSVHDLLEHEFNQLSDVEKEVVYRIGINRDTVSLSKLLRDSKSTRSENQILEAIYSLRKKSMLLQDDKGFFLPLVFIEYINKRLLEKIVT